MKKKLINEQVLDHLNKYGDTPVSVLAALYGDPRSQDHSAAHIRRVRKWWLG